MTIKPLIILPDPLLRVVSKPFERFDAETKRLASDMLDTMYDAPGIGLAAPQLGIARGGKHHVRTVGLGKLQRS